MPLLIISLSAVLVGNIGFWDTLPAVVGAIGVVILFYVVLPELVAAVPAVAAYLYRWVRRRF